jgi:phosphate-selective porin OprO/OprP
MTITRYALAAFFGMFISVQAQASSELELLINMLHENGTVSDAQYGRLMAEVKVSSEKRIEEKKQLQAQLDKATNVEVIVDKGGIHAKSREGEFTAKIGGRVQVDGAWYDEDGTKMGTGSEIRRARLYVQGTMFNDWGYKLQYDFVGTGKNGIRDAFISYNGFEHVKLKVGNFKDPFMLQEQTSSKYITFTERALSDAFAAGRHIGVMASTAKKHWTAALGFFGDSVGVSSADKDEGWGLAGRVTYAPINEKTRVIHLGVASDYRKTGDIDSIRFKQQPETHVAGGNIVDTDIISSVDNFLKVGLEFAAIEGPFSFQSEYIWTNVERSNGADIDFNGWYAETSYFITGESRRYKKGKFSGISPGSIVGRGGIGAWQVAARFSSIDLNDAGIKGGEADSFALGINWFPTSTLRFSANYVRVLEVNGGKRDGEEPSLVQVRGQWAF